MNNLRLATNLKVSHGWAPFEKFDMIIDHLIFVKQRKNIFDFDMKLYGLYLK